MYLICRLIGSPKLQIIFHKRATKYRSLLRKMTYKDKGSYDSSPPCTLCPKCVYLWTKCIYRTKCTYKPCTLYVSSVYILLVLNVYTLGTRYSVGIPIRLVCTEGMHKPRTLYISSVYILMVLNVCTLGIRY